MAAVARAQAGLAKLDVKGGGSDEEGDLALSGEAGTAAADYRRVQYCVVGREGLEFRLGPLKQGRELAGKDDADARLPRLEGVRDIEYSAGDGRVACVLLQNGGVRVVDCESGALVASWERAGIMRMAVSPLGRFVLTWEKHSGGAEGNLVLWSVATRAPVFRAVEKNLLGQTWPTVKFSPDESVAAHMTTNTVHLYRDGDFGKIAHSLRCEGVSQFALSLNAVSREVRVACFKPEGKKGDPARVSVYRPSQDAPVCSQTFFKGSEAALRWSPTGNALLALATTEVDTTGQSYYGESGLYLLHADGKLDCKILPSKEGPFHDVAWAPDGKTFCVVAGRSPASAMLYGLDGNPVFDFGQSAKNTIRWSPHGRFLCLGGFGNLMGDMDFWDMTKRQKMGAARADAAVSQEWSPCGRFFMTATLFPRMRVDNGVTMWSYRGEQLHTVPVKECSKAFWRPAPPGLYPDRPPTPLKKLLKAPNAAAVAVAAAAAGVTTNSTRAAALAAAAPVAKKQAYRPPGATGALASAMNKERGLGAAPKPTPAVPGAAPPPAKGGPSAGDDAQKKSKAAARRERKKKAAASGQAADGDDSA